MLASDAIEFPAVPRAYNAPAVQRAVSQRPLPVWACSAHRVNLPFRPAQSDGATAKLYLSDAVFRELRESPGFYERHNTI